MIEPMEKPEPLEEEYEEWLEKNAPSSSHDCLSCLNWRENPEQCHGCKLNPGYTDNWRGEGSRGFTRDAGRPVNPRCPMSNASLEPLARKDG